MFHAHWFTNCATLWWLWFSTVVMLPLWQVLSSPSSVIEPKFSNRLVTQCISIILYIFLSKVVEIYRCCWLPPIPMSSLSMMSLLMCVKSRLPLSFKLAKISFKSNFLESVLFLISFTMEQFVGIWMYYCGTNCVSSYVPESLPVSG